MLNMLWTRFLVWLENVGSWLLVGVFLAAFVGIVGLIMWKIKKNTKLAIILTAMGTLFCTIPLISTINLLTENKAKNLVISQKKEELKSLELQIENENLKKDKLELENVKLNQSLEIENLNNEIELLKSAQFSMNSLSNICEVALIETELKKTDVNKEKLNSVEGKGIIADKIETEVLVITTHDINAKYGVDLNKVQIFEDNAGVLHVSGIETKYIGSNKNISKPMLGEVREIEYKRSNNGEYYPNKTTVLYDKQSMQSVQKYTYKYETNFQERLSKGLENANMDDVVCKLAQNFIMLTLAPLNKEIIFDSEDSEGISILDYLNEKIKNKELEIEKLQNNELNRIQEKNN